MGRSSVGSKSYVTVSTTAPRFIPCWTAAHYLVVPCDDTAQHATAADTHSATTVGTPTLPLLLMLHPPHALCSGSADRVPLPWRYHIQVTIRSTSLCFPEGVAVLPGPAIPRSLYAAIHAPVFCTRKTHGRCPDRQRRERGAERENTRIQGNILLGRADP